MFVTRKPQEELVDRLDPGYWHPDYERVLEQCRVPLEPLGPYIEHITYGAIVTGEEPEIDEDGVYLIGQGALKHTGV